MATALAFSHAERLGLQLSEGGCVKEVTGGGQAARLGVAVGWKVVAVAGVSAALCSPR